MVHYWAGALAARGHSITVITNTPDPQGLAPGGSYGSLRGAGLFAQWKAMRKADRVVMFNVSLKGLPLVWLSGKPLYVSHHTGLWYDGGAKPLRQRMKQWVANRLAAGNCACSGYIASLYNCCRVIYSPFRADVFLPGKLPRRQGSVVFAGRLVSDKGVDLLLEAFAQLVRGGHNLTLTIIGDGPDREMLEEKARGAGLLAHLPAQGPAVCFMGPLPQPELVAQLQSHEIMVVPSRMEPMGLVVAEGLACGCRMVVSNQGGMPEVGGDFCRYFHSGQANALANAIREELTHPIEIDAGSLQQHLSRFTIPFSADRLEEWLR